MTVIRQLDFFSQESLFVPETEGIKYAGSKLKILPYIVSLVGRLNGIKTVLDGFSGTTRVAQAFSQLGFDTTANDISIWSETFAKCYLLAGNSDKFYQELIDHLNSLQGYEGWFSYFYGGTEMDTKKPFQLKNTKKLDAIRDEIDKLHLNDVDKSVVLTSLIFALDAVDSTMGHYVSYLSKWSARSYNNLFMRLPNRFEIKTKNRVQRLDVFDAISEKHYDLAYFDPPYGSNNEKMPPSRVRYNSYYHIWKSVILNDKPSLFGKANRRVDSKDTVNPSVFEEYRKDDKNHFIALNALEKLIRNTEARYVVLSYSSGGRATKQGLMDVLSSNGLLKHIVEIDYKRNVMANMKWTNEWINSKEDYKEYLFLLEKW